MSHTVRRRKTHNRNDRGRWQLPETERRPAHARQATPEPAPAPPVPVTDHAIVRWLERVVGIDVRENFTRAMLTPERCALIRDLQEGRVRVNDTDVILAITGGRVVSVIVRADSHE